MLAKREEPFGFLRRFASELDRMVAEPWIAFGPRWEALEPRAWMPRLELFEKDNRLVARFEVPGMKKEDVHVEVREGHLVVYGERKHEKEEKKEGFYRTEREYGSFYRTVPLPEGVGIDDVKATIGEQEGDDFPIRGVKRLASSRLARSLSAGFVRGVRRVTYADCRQHPVRRHRSHQ